MSEAVYEAVTKWGRAASPFNIALDFIKLHWIGVTFWAKVAGAAKEGRDFAAHVDGLEKGARKLSEAANQLRSLEGQLAAYPLASTDHGASVVVSAEELDGVRKYWRAAIAIANDAMSLRAE